MLRIRYLRLRAITGSRRFGADLRFSSGLNVIQAGNTSGKSTCLQAIIYALGLERSLGPQLEIPLPYAMRERIHRQRDEDYEPVLQSHVEVELENSHGEILTVRRDVVGGKDTRLIQTIDAPVLSEPSSQGRQRDFFVHDPGAAQREDGFHNYLARFMRWELPLVPRFDGEEGPLYLEAIFPMLFVEQKRGWSSIQGPFPTFLRIQDVARRVMEFLLDLDAGRIRRERAEIRRRLAALQQRWTLRRAALDEQAGRLIRFRGIPGSPTPEFSHEPKITIEVLQSDTWIPLANAVATIAARVEELQAAEVPTAENAAPELEEKLTGARGRVDQLAVALETIRGEFSAQMQEHRAVESRVAALEIDLKRNQDALKLKRLGSDIGQASGESVCPTCHQHISNELLPSISVVGMGLEENLTFVNSQLELYRATLQSSAERLNNYRARYDGADQELRAAQQEIRALRQALIQPSSSPSRAIIEEMVRLQALLDRLRSIQELVDSSADEFRSIAKESTELQESLRKLSADDLTDKDKAKVTTFQSAVQAHLARYGFRSFRPNEINLSRDNFRPLVLTSSEDGLFVEKEINFEVSASDAIRLKWAYYLSMLSVATQHQTNHCGLAVFDEPGQQEIEAGSLHSFLAWSADEVATAQQIIVATSEPIDSLRRILHQRRATLITFDSFILQPMT